MRPVIIAECGLNHDGQLARALDLVAAASQSGASIAKFQTFIPDRILRRSDPEYGLLARYALPLADFVTIAKRCGECNIEFCSTPGDEESLRFLVEECGVKRVKIGSDDLTNRPLVQAAFATGLPVILSTGMATLPEIHAAIRNHSGDVTLLHCVSLYPTPAEHVNLRAIQTLRHVFHDCRIGYSDHTVGTLAPIAAAALGAEVIEKHLKFLGSDPIDAKVSIDQHRFLSMVREIRALTPMLGDGIKLPREDERRAAAKLRKGEDGLRGAAA